jgi:endonuclease/exonuclease/phosphatase family metal-dependent hydrolase
MLFNTFLLFLFLVSIILFYIYYYQITITEYYEPLDNNYKKSNTNSNSNLFLRLISKLPSKLMISFDKNNFVRNNSCNYNLCKGLSTSVKKSKLSTSVKKSKLSKSVKEISIITYNIQKFPWSLKTFTKIKELLNNYSIILLQECYDDSLSSLQTNFPDYYIYRNKLDGIYEFNLLRSGLVILSKYPIDKFDSVSFKNYNPETYDRLSQKGFIICWINNICIINTHLQSSDFIEYDQYALLQLQEIFSYIKNIQGDYIIGGDFNIDINIMNSIYKNNKKFTFNYPSEPTIFMDYKTGKSYSKYKIGTDSLIFDYFITKKSGNIKLSNTTTIYDSYSDHNPVSTIIKIK